MAWSKHYIVGVSVGVAAQPSAIAVIEQESYSDGAEQPKVTALRLRLLQRMALDTSYPDLAKRLRAIRDGLKGEEKAQDTAFLVDITGTGSSVVEFFRKEDIDPSQVTITAGSGQTETKPRQWRLSKRELIGSLQVLLHTDKFQIAASLDLVSALKEELANFKMKMPAANGDDIDAWREGQSQDLVLAVAIAAWWGQKDIPIPSAEFDRVFKMINDPERLRCFA